MSSDGNKELAAGEDRHTTGKSIECRVSEWTRYPCSALSVVVFLMLVGSVAADTKATKGNADAQHHNRITFPCTSCGLASEVAAKPFLLGGALQVSFVLRVLSPPFTAMQNQANEIARV